MKMRRAPVARLSTGRFAAEITGPAAPAIDDATSDNLDRPSP